MDTTEISIRLHTVFPREGISSTLLFLNMANDLSKVLNLLMHFYMQIIQQ